MTMSGYVPAHSRDDFRREHVDVLKNGVTMAGDVMGHRQQTHHAASSDNAMTHSLASLTYSGAYGVVFLVVTALLGWLAWVKLDADPVWVVAIVGVLWGCATYYALAYNREQGLHHSASGIAHAEIDSRERVAIHAIDAHLRIVEKQLGLDDEPAPRISVSKRIHQNA